MSTDNGEKSLASFILSRGSSAFDLDLGVFFSNNSILKLFMPSYEVRPQQLQMAKAIKDAIENFRQIVVEAGTGVGKSLSYLIPSILWAMEGQRRVVISTCTKALQEQLIEKDIPFLEKVFSALNIRFTYSLCVGSENYICLRRLMRTVQEGLWESDSEMLEIKTVLSWIETTHEGLILKFPFGLSLGVLDKICREPDLCLGKNCEHVHECFYRKAMSKVMNSQLIVVNHHLFFINIASQGKILPNFDGVIFDEAHSINEVATTFFGQEIANTQIKWLLNSIYNPSTNKGILSKIEKGVPERWVKKIKKKLAEVSDNSNIFFSQFLPLFEKDSEPKRIRDKSLYTDTITGHLMELSEWLKENIDTIESQEDRIELKAYSERVQNLAVNINIFIDQKFENYVYWVEYEPEKRYKRIILKSAPIDISQILREKFFMLYSPVVLTSATLTVDKKFSYFTTQCGIDDHIELLLDSPFDYSNRVILYIPFSMPDPVFESAKFEEQSIEEICRILKITQGNTFVLFTSYLMLNNTYQRLCAELPNLVFFKQGDMPRYVMLEKFKSTDNAVLLGTTTFWQGVDVPGEDLICVIIARLPFDVPCEPIVEARIEYLKSQGKDAFKEYSLPEAILMFRQGFGRLMRRKEDWGIISVLDPRLRTRKYGEKFLNSIPKVRIVSELGEVEKFYYTFKKKSSGA